MLPTLLAWNPRLVEGLGRAHAQMYAHSVNGFERHRKEMGS